MTAPVFESPEDQAAWVGSMEAQLAGLEMRTGATAKRRADEVRGELAALMGVQESPARGGRQSRPRVAAEKRGE